MNKQRRNAIDRVITEINSFALADETLETRKAFFDDIYSRVYYLQTEEEEAFDNMPENLQSSMRGMAAEEAMELLDEAVSVIDDIRDGIDNDDLIDSKVDILTDLLVDALYV